MNIEIQVDPADEVDRPRKSLKPPPNYLSLRVRPRLFSLFAALILVIIMMKEARKPETWSWMGFEASPTVGNDLPTTDSTSSTIPEPAPTASSAAKAHDESTRSGDSLGTVDNVESFVDARNQQLIQLIDDGAAYPAVGEQFWNESFKPLKVSGQRNLFRLLRMVVEQAEFQPNFRETAEDLVAALTDRRAQFHKRIAENIEYLPSAERREEVAEQLASSKSHWEELVQSWNASLEGTGITMSQLQLNSKLRGLLNALALDQVEDGTGLNWNDEASAWLLCWERAQDLEANLETPDSVQQIQLVSQPETFRGQPVEISGWIRSARRMEVSENELGMDHFFVLWIRPADTNVMPYCVYAARLPKTFPELSTSFEEFNEPVTVRGVFYKIRTYTAANDEVVTCPMLLAETFVVEPPKQVAEQTAWSPPLWSIISFLVVMPVLAGGIAWLAFVSTETRRFIPGGKTQQKIDQSLVELGKDPTIMSDLERVKMLGNSDAEPGPTVDE